MLSHPARDVGADRSAKAANRYNQHVVAPMRRPGLVQMHQWRPEASDPVAPSSAMRPSHRNPDSLKCPT